MGINGWMDLLDGMRFISIGGVGVGVGVVGVVLRLAVGVMGVVMARRLRLYRLASSFIRRAMPRPYWSTAS